MRNAAYIVVALLAATSVAVPTVARAQRCPAIEGGAPELAELPTAERMAFLLARAERGEEAARTWTAIFALGYLGIAAGQLAVLSVSRDQERRDNMAIGAASSMIGVASLFVLPLSILHQRADIEALAARASEGDCEALARAEALMVAAAESEAFGASWLVHVGSVLFNLGVGLLLGVGYGHWISGAISAGVGIAIGELQILTQPTDLVDAVERYRRGDLALAPTGSIAAGPGFALGGTF